MGRLWPIIAATGLTLLAAVPAAAMTVDRIVIVMRHGVRPPTKDPPLPAGITPESWPHWPVAPGELTPHGAAAVRTIGRADGGWLRTEHLLRRDACPQAADLQVVADSDQRTVATAQAWAAGVAPDCAVPVTHRPRGEDDPLFGGGAIFDPDKVDRMVARAVGPGGTAALDRRWRPLLDRLDAVLCGPAPRSGCGVQQQPTRLDPAARDRAAKLKGALDVASTAAQMLLLEYAEGMPADAVGWGRADAADVTALSAFHALEFRLLARPRPVARAKLARLSAAIRGALKGKGARVTLFAGHDTQIGNLGGLLDAHWQVPGFAPDDPAPGGAIILERLTGRGGRRFVRVSYRAQTLDGIRAGDALPLRYEMRVPACAQATRCTLDEMERLLR